MVMPKSKKSGPLFREFVVINDRNVYHYTKTLASRKDAKVVDGPYAAAVLMRRGVGDENAIVKQYGEQAQKQMELEDTEDGEEALENADVVINTRVSRGSVNDSDNGDELQLETSDDVADRIAPKHDTQGDFKFFDDDEDVVSTLDDVKSESGKRTRSISKSKKSAVNT